MHIEKFVLKDKKALLIGIATAALACEACKFITGQTIYVDGGYQIMD